MKLFIKDHLDFILLFIFVFFGLGLVIELLDGIENNYLYFVFLSGIFFIIFLIIKYIKNYRIYNSLSKEPNSLEEMIIANPKSHLEWSYSKNQRMFYKIFNEEILENESIQRQYKTLIEQNIHQLKTPLSTISMISQNNKDNEDFKKVLVQVDNLDYYLSQTLNYIRLRDVKKDLKIEKVYLKKLISEVINELKDYFILNSIFPSIEFSEDIFIYSDKKLLKSVIYQIINNAIKYGKKDSKVIFSIDGDGEITLNISNEGIGISSSDLDRIFDIFYTGDTGRIYGESSGIGLYLVKNILNELSHNISVTSVQNEKTTFSIHFNQK